MISGNFLSYSILGWKQLKVSNPYPATIFGGPENDVCFLHLLHIFMCTSD